MRTSIVRSVIEDLSEALRLVDDALQNWWKELGELGTDPARTRLCLVAALTVPLATVMALWLEVESVWWAAISGYMTIMASGAASVRKVTSRMLRPPSTSALASGTAWARSLITITGTMLVARRSSSKVMRKPRFAGAL